MSYSFSGPSAVELIPAVAGAALVGKIYTSLAQTNSQPVYILMIREVADFALYRIASYFVESAQKRAEIYAMTNLVVNIGTLTLLHQKELIGMLGTALFICLMVMELFCKTLDFKKYHAAPG